MGNPPFLGSLHVSDEQKKDTKRIWNDHPKTGLVDFVTNWFLIAGRWISEANCRVAFVSTNSIIQGEQPSLLWQQLRPLEIEIDFAHRPFTWTNEAKGKAAVDVVILGLSQGTKKSKKSLWSYPDSKGDPQVGLVDEINAYLIDAADVIIGTLHTPLSVVLPKMSFGSMPRDNGHISKISFAEAEEIRASDPIAAKFLRPLIGAEEMINGGDRYCLWLENASPTELNSSPNLKQRVKAVQEMRLGSAASSTRAAAKTPHLFVQRAQPISN
jgi:hypothetical protein